MNNEGQEVQFSSSKIPEKEMPDFFVASNDKENRRKRLDFSKIFAALKNFFKNLGTKLVEYFKHPLKGKHKIATIIIAAIVVAAATLITLSLTIWRSAGMDTSPLTEEELREWNTTELPRLVFDASQLSDDEAKDYYADLIKTEKREYKVIDLTINYARELAVRGFVDQSLDLLDAMSIEDMECDQVMNYYVAYKFTHYMMANYTSNSQTEYYDSLAKEQEEICIFENLGIEVDLDAEDSGIIEEESTDE